MKVQIEGNLYIESDTLGYQVKSITGTRIDEKTQKEIEISNTHGYFISIKGCVNHILRMKLNESTATNLVDLLREVEGIRAYIESKVAV